MKVGIPAPYVSSHYMLKVLLEKNGLSLADVESIGVGLADGAGHRQWSDRRTGPR